MNSNTSQRRGDNLMEPFDQLDRSLTEFLGSNGIISPTAIQERAIPCILQQECALLLAPTGSGKTEAALLPLINQLFKMKMERELFGFYIIYVTPLRALNRDVFKRIEDLCNHLGITVAVRHGDTSQYFRRKQAINPPNLLITTPESLQAILPGKRLRYHLKTVFAVVVDEIHELADSKRGTQLALGLERLEILVGKHIQRIGLSATVGNPKEVAHLLAGTGRKVKTIWAGYKDRIQELRVEMPLPSDVDKKISRKISYPMHSTARLRRIIELVESHNSTLIFTNTRSFAEVLGAKMRLLKPSFEYDVHHGSLSKNIRLSAEDRLKGGISKAIIATSSLELGIDIGQADLVIQYSSPRKVSRALQRTGRAGHGIGQVSEGVIVSTMNADDISESAVILRRASMNKVENADIHKDAWDVLAHQIAGILLDTNEIETKDLLRIIKSAHPFSSMDEIQLTKLLVFMEDRRIIIRDDERIKRGKKARIFYYENLSTIPDIKKVNAIDMSTRSSIGVLDENYVIENVELGSVFVIRGRPWQVVSIEEDEVLCAPTIDIDTEAPKWVGEMIPVPFEVAAEVGSFWLRIATRPENETKKWVNTNYFLKDEMYDHVCKTVKSFYNSNGVVPNEDLLIIESFGQGLVLHSTYGTRVNETLGIVLAALLTTRIGVQVGVERDPYRILFTSDTEIDPSNLLDIFKDYDREQITTILRMVLKQTLNFVSRFVHVAKRMDVIRRDVQIKDIPIKRIVQASEGKPVFEEAMREVLHEKLDEKRSISIFERISNGSLDVKIIKTKEPSSLARLIVEEKSRFEVIGELTEENEILKMMEERLLAKKFRLVCLNCNWNSIRTVSTLDEDVRCPSCNGKMIAVLPSSNETFTKIVKKRVTGKSLSKQEQKEYTSRSLTASLVAQYGKTALIVLAGRGIGPQTASRILKPSLTERIDVLRAIAKAEIEYARTRPFW
jgi:ATP-dependent Lhr-like helicase